MAAAVETVRPYQWLKNLLVFVPLAAAHGLHHWPLLAAAVRAFAAFSLCASSIYVFDDLTDVPADRTHPHKCLRPIASGRLSRTVAIALVPLLLGAGLAIGAGLDIRTEAVLLLYFGLMVLYALRLRAIVLLDAFVLACGYALRVLAGGFAVHVNPSSWLLAFCIFIFLSLALIKRYAELSFLEDRDGPATHARGYLLQDKELMVSLGSSSGALSVLVLALYMSASHVEQRYAHPYLIWAVSVLLLYWISYMWLMAHRARMTDDPLVFALKDRVSRSVILVMGALVWLAI